MKRGNVYFLWLISVMLIKHALPLTFWLHIFSPTFALWLNLYSRLFLFSVYQSPWASSLITSLSNTIFLNANLYVRPLLLPWESDLYIPSPSKPLPLDVPPALLMPQNSPSLPNWQLLFTLSYKWHHQPLSTPPTKRGALLQPPASHTSPLREFVHLCHPTAILQLTLSSFLASVISAAPNWSLASSLGPLMQPLYDSHSAFSFCHYDCFYDKVYIK